MQWLDKARLRFRSLFRRSRVEHELDDELQFYLDAEIAKHRAAGFGPVEADQAARRSLGDMVRLKEACRDTRGLNPVDALRQDVRYAGRGLLRSPVFTLAATLIVALGIGANTAVFTVVNAVLFKPPPYMDPARVVSVYQDSDAGDPNSSSFPATRDMAAQTNVFSGVAAMSSSPVTWEADDGPRQALVEYVTASYFPVLGLDPMLGRWFEPAADRVGAGNYAVVSHPTWRSQFGADPGVVGRTIRMGGQPVTVVGVGPEGFNGSGGALVTDFWVSISSVGVGGDFRVANLERREDHWYEVRARLAPGVTVAQAQAAMDVLAERLATDFPDLNRGRGITVFGQGQVRVHPEVDGALVPAAFVLLGIVGLILVLACANLANLLIVRGFSRGQEVAIRRALGASRGRVARLFLTESILLALLGGAVGMLLARWCLGFVPSLVGPLGSAAGAAGALDVSMDLRVLLYAAALTLVTGVLFGLAPALRSARGGLAGVLREEGHSTSPGRRAALLRNGLVSLQVAVSLVLLVGAMLLTRSLANVQGVDPGVDADRLAFVATSFGVGSAPAAARAARVDELRDRASALPGVTAVAVTTRLPVQSGGSTTTVVEGYTPPTGTDSVELPVALVDEHYFQAVGLRLVAGRGFGRADSMENPVAVVNETAARRFWGDTNPAGRRLRPQGATDSWIPVVGVVADSKVSSLNEPPSPMLYYPIGQSPASGYVLVRTEGDPAALLAPLRAELRGIGGELPLSALGTLESRVASSLAVPRIAASLLGLFSLLAVVLASLGIYGVVSFVVARRAPEMGIRIALGGDRAQLIRMVMREMLATVAVGLAAGTGLALLVAPALQPALYQVAALDTMSFVVGAASLVAVATLATYLPARRAAAVDPVVALRAR